MNSRYCCNKRPPTVGRNLEYFYPKCKVVFKKSAKLFSRKRLSCNILPRHLIPSSSHSLRLCTCHRCVHFIQHTLVINVCVTVRKATLLISSRVKVKTSRFHPVVGGISLQQYLLLNNLKSWEYFLLKVGFYQPSRTGLCMLLITSLIK